MANDHGAGGVGVVAGGVGAKVDGDDIAFFKHPGAGFVVGHGGVWPGGNNGFKAGAFRTVKAHFVFQVSSHLRFGAAGPNEVFVDKLLECGIGDHRDLAESLQLVGFLDESDVFDDAADGHEGDVFAGGFFQALQLRHGHEVGFKPDAFRPGDGGEQVGAHRAGVEGLNVGHLGGNLGEIPAVRGDLRL